MENPQPQKGRVRSFVALLGLSIVTLTIYYYYWLYVNIKEMKEGFSMDDEDSVFKAAQTTFWFKIGILLVTIIGSIAMTVPAAIADPENIVIPRMLIIFPIMGFCANIAFFYFFGSCISKGQQRAQLTSYNALGAFALYLISSAIELIGGITVLRSDMMSNLSSIDSMQAIFTRQWIATLSGLSMLNFIGNVLWLAAIFIVQEQINRIWREGTGRT